MTLNETWEDARVLEPMGFVDEQMNTVGAFVLTTNQPAILSLHPAEDFELNTDIIHQWKVVLQNSLGEIIGDADYNILIKELSDFIADQQNGSILIRALDDDELSDLHARTIFE